MGRARGAPRGRLGGRASWCGIGAGRRRPIPAPYPRRAALLSLGRDAEKRYLASSRARCRGAASGGWRLTWHDWATAKTAAGSLTPALIPCAQVTHGAGREKRWPRPNETSLFTRSANRRRRSFAVGEDGACRQHDRCNNPMTVRRPRIGEIWVGSATVTPSLVKGYPA